MKATAREWIEKAEADFLSANREYRARKKPNFDATCFFAQQCIEKYLKGRLAEAGRPIPKTHDLSILLDAVLFRYPGESANRSLAKTAIADASWARSMFRNSLRLRGR